MKMSSASGLGGAQAVMISPTVITVIGPWDLESTVTFLRAESRWGEATAQSNVDSNLVKRSAEAVGA